MARTTPAQKPRGEHSMTSRTGLAAGGTVGEPSFSIMLPSILLGDGPGWPSCQGRSGRTGIALTGPHCLYTYLIPVIPDDIKLRPHGRAEQREILPCRSSR